MASNKGLGKGLGALLGRERHAAGQSAKPAAAAIVKSS